MYLKLTKTFSLTLERPFVHFGTFVRTPTINLKLCKNIEDINFTKNFKFEIFYRVIFIVDFEYELRIDKNYEILPVSANSSIFGTFARTHPITLKLYQNIKDVILIKNNEKKLAIIMVIWP